MKVKLLKKIHKRYRWMFEEIGNTEFDIAPTPTGRVIVFDDKKFEVKYYLDIHDYINNIAFSMLGIWSGFQQEKRTQRRRARAQYFRQQKKKGESN